MCDVHYQGYNISLLVSIFVKVRWVWCKWYSSTENQHARQGKCSPGVLGSVETYEEKNISESNKRKKDASQANPVLHSTPNLHIGSITALQNTKTSRKCGYCSGSHGYTITNCSKRKTLQDNGREYDLSKKNVISSLFCTIESAMSIVSYALHHPRGVIPQQAGMG